jgi:hypothetical protein
MLKIVERASELLQKAKGAVGLNPVDGPGPVSGLWLDHPRAEALLRERTSSEFLRRHVGELIRDGVTRIPGVVSAGVCDELVQEFRQYCAEHSAEATDYRDVQGYHSRLCNLHLSSQRALGIGLQPRVLDVLDFAFGRRAAICSSLVFEKGSQQAIHRDSPFFHTQPEGQFFGVWTALEDVSPDAGPLTYHVGGHRIPVDRLKIARDNPGKPHGELFGEYIRQVVQECTRRDIPLTRADFMRKGDVLIWHPQLPHGGSPIQRPELTRKSVVFHYMPEGAPIHGLEPFFGGEFPNTPNSYRWENGRAYIDHGQPRFDHNY